MFSRFYESFWQHPLLLWVFPVLFVFVLPRRWGPFYGYLWFFTVETMVDPLCTGPLAEWTHMSDGVATATMILFVLLGDFRYFWLLERFDAQGTHRRALSRATGWTFVVPLFTALLIGLFPVPFENPRHTFLAYEVAFFCLALAIRTFFLPRRSVSPERLRWLAAVTHYVLLYYGLWALADVIIMAGHDFGFGVRVVPNVLYYGLFLPFVFWKAPEDLKSVSSRPDATSR